MAAIVDRFVPENDMEAEVAALLEKAGAHTAAAMAEAEENLALKVRLMALCRCCKCGQVRFSVGRVSACYAALVIGLEV